MAGKITSEMNMTEIVVTMCEGHPGALEVVDRLLKTTGGLYDILFLDGVDVRGLRLYTLYNECCERNPEKFDRTLLTFRAGVFSDEQIYANLGRIRSIPFIDDSIKIKGVPPYGMHFGPNNPVWKKWCKAQIRSFERRMLA